MHKKPLILGIGAFVLVLGSFLGVGCSDDEEDTGTATPTADDSADPTADDSADPTAEE